MNNIKKLREIKNLSQEKLAEVLDVSVESIKKYEGDRQIPIKQAIKISQKYGVSLDWIYCQKEYINEQDTMAEVLNALRKTMTITVERQGDRNVPFIQIDIRFANFLQNVRKLEDYIISQNVRAEDSDFYVEERKKIFDNHKKYLTEIFEKEVTFDKGTVLNIYGIKNKKFNADYDTILNYF